MKSIEKFYDMPMGIYCGVLMREKTAKKLSKLLYKQNQEIKELLASNLDDIEVSNWTLAYPEGKQTSVSYYIKSDDQSKLERINLIDQTAKMKFCEEAVFIVDSHKDAETSFLEWYENTKVSD